MWLLRLVSCSPAVVGTNERQKKTLPKTHVVVANVGSFYVSRKMRNNCT